MKVIVVDDEKHILEYTLRELATLDIVGKADGFRDPSTVLDFVRSNPVDIAFLDIEMPNISGLELAKSIKGTSPETHIIFLTGFRKYAVEAFEIRANGYIVKPATSKKLLAEIENVQSLMRRGQENKIRVQTFGNFEVFYGSVPLKFGLTKTKELFAYLIDRRGASLTMGELATVLWEDSEKAQRSLSFLRHLISDLLSTLNNIGVKDIIIKRRNQIAVDTEKIDCDYYGFLKGDLDSINAFKGEYMAQYSWAAFTTGSLASKQL